MIDFHCSTACSIKVGTRIWWMSWQAYSVNFDLDAVVKNTGGNFNPAVGIRTKLEKAAHQAVWGDNLVSAVRELCDFISLESR